MNALAVDDATNNTDTDALVLDRTTAIEWSSWFEALGDPTRVQILHLLSTSERALTVGELTDRLDVGQSTVSHHLAKLAAVRFVLVDRIGTASHWRVNDACLRCFPSAAEIVMGRIDTSFTDALSNPAASTPTTSELSCD